VRDILVGLGVSIFIALFKVYVYPPSVFRHWLNRLLH
jgi:hypothetical protein